MIVIMAEIKRETTANGSVVSSIFQKLEKRLILLKYRSPPLRARLRRTSTSFAASMKHFLLLALWFLLALGGSAMAQSAGAPAEMISNFRLEHGEGRVTLDPTLNRIAHEQAAAMAAKDVLDHDVLGPFGSRVAVAKSGRAAENIAYGYDNFPKTLDQWIASSGHRKNLLLPDASRVGIASAKSAATGRTYWAMEIAGDYERPKTERPKTERRKAERAKAETGKVETANVTGAKPAATVKPKVHAQQACRIKLLGLCL